MNYTLAYYESSTIGKHLKEEIFSNKEDALERYRLTYRGAQPELYEGKKLLRRKGHVAGMPARYTAIK